MASHTVPGMIIIRWAVWYVTELYQGARPGPELRPRASSFPNTARLMAQVITDKEKLLRRTERLIGQVEAVKRSIEEGDDSADVMHLLSAARGAINSLMAEVVEDHIRDHLAETSRKRSAAETRAVEELIEVVKASLT